MALEGPTSDQLEYIHSQLNMTPKSIERDVQHLKDWIALQPHLPDGIDERRFRNLLYFCKNSVEKVKRVVDLYYTVRGQVPEFYDNRDPLDPDLQNNFHNVFVYPLPRLTSDGCRVLMFRIWDSNPALFNVRQTMMLTFMAGDIRLLEDTSLSDILVFDLRGFSLTHLSTVTIPLLKKFMFVGQTAFPIRQKAVHIIHTPPFVDKILMLFKPLMKEKLAKRLFVHSQGLGNLFDYVPRSLFPEDYGGDQAPLKELHESWKKKLIENRDFFLAEASIYTDESKRPGKAKNVQDLFGMEGSFRALTVD